MKPLLLTCVSLASLSACAVDGPAGDDDLDTAETAQAVTTTIDPGVCDYSIDLRQYSDTVVVKMPAATLIARGCNHAVVYPTLGSRPWLASVDWIGTTGQCAIGSLTTSLEHLTSSGWTSPVHNADQGEVTSTNPPACIRPKLVLDLTENAKNRIGEKAYYFQNGNEYLVDSTVTFIPE